MNDAFYPFRGVDVDRIARRISRIGSAYPGQQMQLASQIAFATVALERLGELQHPVWWGTEATTVPPAGTNRVFLLTHERPVNVRVRGSVPWRLQFQSALQLLSFVSSGAQVPSPPFDVQYSDQDVPVLQMEFGRVDDPLAPEAYLLDANEELEVTLAAGLRLIGVVEAATTAVTWRWRVEVLP